MTIGTDQILICFILSLTSSVLLCAGFVKKFSREIMTLRKNETEKKNEQKEK